MNFGEGSVGLSFLAGMLAFLSPCFLAVLPAYLLGVGAAGVGPAAQARIRRRRGDAPAAVFVLAFAAAFVLLGATASAAGIFLRDNLRGAQVAGGVSLAALAVLAIATAGGGSGRQEGRIPRWLRPLAMAGGGAGVAAAWVPCIGPTLATALLLAGMRDTAGRGILLLAAFGAGLAVPMLALGFLASRAAAVPAAPGPRRAAAWILGGLLLVVALFVASGRLSWLTARLAAYGPFIGAGI